MKKALSLVLAAVLSLAVFAGCSGSSGESTASAPPASQEEAAVVESNAPAEPAASAAAGEQIQFLLTYPQEKVELYKILEEFQVETGIELEILYMPLADAKTQINIMVASNTLADVLDIDGIDTRAYAAMGILAELDEKIAQDIDIGQYYEGPLEFGMYQDKCYGLPLSPSNLSLFYNKEMFAEAGIAEPPATWDEMRTTLAALTGDDVYGIAMPANKSSDAAFCFLAFLFQSGGTIETLGEEATVTALNLYQEMLDNKWMSVEMANWGLEDGANQFLGQKAAMLIDGCWRVKSMTANATFEWDTAPLPAGPAGLGTALGGHNIAAAKGDKFDAAWELIAYINRPDNMQRFCESENYLPARKDVSANSTYFQTGAIKAFADSLEFTNPRGPLVKWPAYESVMIEMVQSVIVGAKTPEDAAAAANEEMKQFLD